ncbi:uncharacterized protein N0V89_010402 [Didymosphaeria variabile]|uniref:Uncharacterized protein n=1 Tax=Didymosphaeria variabile TaxID=1932322 RepID=A0A9W8XBI9_9PLEO|nr:uncharacterized protein N0V89_010402 [Didymosphaeria variabile]KAJ4346473.1 hypothetical protein N0V89_010402 [Didymosphaeria variabile]
MRATRTPPPKSPHRIPFLALPTATLLPYTYKQLLHAAPSILSSNATSDPTNPQSQSQPQQPPAYVVSSSGTTATPDQILSSCLALQSHLQSLENEARSTLRAWEDKRKAEELAEKRRVAPGWLDGDVKLLRPENVGGGDTEMGEASAQAHGQAPLGTQQRTRVGINALLERRDGVPDPSEGEELDRAFGGMDLK